MRHGEEVALVDQHQQVARLGLEELAPLAEHLAVEAVHPVVVVAVKRGPRDTGAAANVGHLEALADLGKPEEIGRVFSDF